MTESEKEALAAEYVLGLLDADQSASCEALAASDPDFAGRVEVWRRNLIEIDMTVDPEPPTEMLWQRIQTDIAYREPARPVAAAPGTASKLQEGWFATLWGHLPAWRAVGLTAATACLALAVALALQTRDIARTPILVAVMMSDQNRPLALVNAFRDGRTELVPLEAISAPEGKSLQVWTLWDRSRGPVSVGLLEAMRSIDLNVEGLPATSPDQLFEVTLEPAGGSPTGRPTGRILMKGNASSTETGI
ncbi:anti-sigma factor domain-containing protein [Ancylobacter sp. G4_0304]|uniref:anti-sigma factor n=1 Tax=Ancylobacter sp. G4_0304 TaxID=3114289 RepID=UPI0039C70F33